MSVRQLLNFVYSWAIQRVDPEKVEQWITDLNAPYWSRKPTPATAERRAQEERDSFRAAMAAG